MRVVKSLNLRDISEYIAGRSDEIPQENITALEVALRTAPMRELIYTGRGFSWEPPAEMVSRLRIGDGCEAWTTFYQSFKPLENRMILSFDVMYTAMYTVQSMAELALEILKGATAKHQQLIGEEVLHRRLSEKEIRKLSNEFRGLKITQEVQIDRYGAGAEAQYRIEGITSAPASIFDFEGPRLSRINVA